MKKILLTFSIIAIISLRIFGQSPSGFKYQVVLRNASNIILNNQSVTMLLNIRQGSIGGTIVYSEMFSTSSNSYGLVNLEIGSGTTPDDFSIIDWANDGPYFLETAVSFSAGSPWIVMGTSPLLSVPYAFHANTANSLVGGINSLEADPVFTASVAGGITASDTAYWNSFVDTDTQLDSVGIANLGYVAGPHTIDTDTQQDSVDITNLGFVAGPHTIDTDTQLDSVDIANFGYVAGPHTIDADTQLDSVDIANFGFVAEKTYTLGLYPELGGYIFRISSDGKHGLVAEIQDQTTSLVKWYGCDNYINTPSNHNVFGRGFFNWRLPSKNELNEMYIHRIAIGGNFNLSYWTSTRETNLNAWQQDFNPSGNGSQNIGSVNSPSNYVRAVREF